MVMGVAQETFDISGVVRDTEGAPVTYATVSIPRCSMGTQSDVHGAYILRVPRGRYEVVVSAVGYVTVRRTVEVSGSMKRDFALETVTYDLRTVEVVGKAQDRILREKAYTVSNVDVQSVAASLSSLSTLVGRTSGIRIREEGGLGSDYNLSINGLSGNAIRYFVDGMPLSALGSGINLGNLPVNIVDHIEIYKGVIPAELGEDALGGAVNIITRRHGNSYFDASVSGGSFHTLRGDVSGQYVDEHTGFTVRPSVGVSYSKNDYIMRGVEVWDESSRKFVDVDLRRFHDGYRSVFGQVEAGFTRRTWADEAFVAVSGMTSHKEIQTGMKQSIVIGDATRDVKSLSVSARYQKNHFLLDGLTARFSVSYTADHTLLTDTAFRAYRWDRTWVTSPYSEVTGRGKSVRHYLRPQVTARANLNYHINDVSSVNFNYLHSGTGNHRYDDYDELFIPTCDRMDKHVLGLTYNRSFLSDRLSTSIFLKDYIFHVELNQKDLYWLTGVNDVETKATRSNMGYGVGVRCTVSPVVALKASYEKSVRLPIAREFLGNGETVYANFKLRPEKAHNINFGAFGEVQRQRHRFMYETNLFGRVVQDYILRQTIGERQSQYSNVSAATVLGAEGEVSYIYDGILRATLNATYLEERNKMQKTPEGRDNPVYNNRMPNRPWLYANAELSYNHAAPFGLRDSRLTVDYSFRYTQWFYLTWEAFGSRVGKAVIPSQYSHDIAATWFFDDDKYSLSLECSNIFDRKLYDNYMLQKPGRAFVGKFRIFIH